MDFCSDRAFENVRTKFEVRSFTNSCDNIWGTQKIGKSLDTATLPFLHPPTLQTDRRHAISILRFALKCIARLKKSDAQRSAQRALQRTLTLVQSGTKLHVLGRKWRKGGMLGRGRKTLSKVKYSDAVWQTVP